MQHHDVPKYMFNDTIPLNEFVCRGHTIFETPYIRFLIRKILYTFKKAADSYLEKYIDRSKFCNILIALFTFYTYILYTYKGIVLRRHI